MTILADGQVAVAKTAIFEVGDTDILDTTCVKVEKITLFNTSAIVQTAIVYIKRVNGTSRAIRQFMITQNDGGEYLEPGEFLNLEAGDMLEAQTTTAAVVNFVLFGEHV